MFLVTLALWAAEAHGGMVELVSRAVAPGGPATGGGSSFAPSRSLSADGRYLVFESSAPNLIPGFSVLHNPQISDIYLFDRVTGLTRCVDVSATFPGRAANFGASAPSITADGRWIVFQSDSTDLVAGVTDSNQTIDVYLFDRLAGSTVLVSHAAGSSTAASGLSSLPTVSDDGRWVAFTSYANDLVLGQSPGNGNLFVWDRTSGETVLASHVPGSATISSNAGTSFSLISADGSTVVFTSSATNLVAGSGSAQQVYAWDRASNASRLVSHVAGIPTTGSGGLTGGPDLSANGRYVAYQSTATNLVALQTGSGAFPSVFLWDRDLDVTVLVSRSVGSTASPGGGASDSARISADGRFVVYRSVAADLVAGFVDGNGVYGDIFVFDRVAGSNALVSRKVGTTSRGGNGDSFLAAVSADGSKIAYSSRGNDLIASLVDGNADGDTFVFDRNAGTATLTSHIAGFPLITGNGDTSGPAISADGNFIAVQTLATNLFPGVADGNRLGDLILVDLNGGATTLVSQAASDAPCLSGNGGSVVSGGLRSHAISADGRYVAYASVATNLVAGQVGTNQILDVFVADRWSSTSSLVSHAAGLPSRSGNFGGDTFPSISGDGRWVAYVSNSTDLVSGYSYAGFSQVFLYDRLSGTNVLVTRRNGAPASANGPSSEPIASRDGRFIVFTSDATDLVAGDANGKQDVFLYDRAGDVVTLVSHRSGASVSANEGSSSPSISADGSLVTFFSTATDLTAGETGGPPGAIYAFARATGAVVLVSHAAGKPSQRANEVSNLPVVSGDGHWVVYDSLATDIVAGQIDFNAAVDVFLWDGSSGNSILVSRTAASPVAAGNAFSGAPSLSADGRFVAFVSESVNLGPLVPAGVGQVFLYDRASGAMALVSRTPSGTGGNAHSGQALMVSADGSHVAFWSIATNLVAGFVVPTISVANYFLFNRADGGVHLASGARSSPVAGGDGQGLFPGDLSDDGGVLVWETFASNLVPGDFNLAGDVFAYREQFAGPPSGFSPLTPCRVIDTRDPAGPFGGPALAADGTRAVTLAGRCGIPFDAVAVSANVTVVGPAADGALSLYPAGFTAGGTSTVSYRAGQTRASSAILGLGAGGATAVEMASPGAAHLVIDVNGYFR